jgi:maleylpyruvate isomerase
MQVEGPSGRGPVVRVATVPWVRTREVLYHHVDLATGFTLADAPDALLRAGLAECPPRLTAATPGVALTCSFSDGSTELVVVGDGAVAARGPAHAVLGWLTGRSAGTDLTADGPLPALPTWG